MESAEELLLSRSPISSASRASTRSISNYFHQSSCSMISLLDTSAKLPASKFCTRGTSRSSAIPDSYNRAIFHSCTSINATSSMEMMLLLK
ncbi:hypothetical protein LINPERHAP1_LOCUS8049 [Linum perenne]